jgi:hypothetical protein
MENQKSAKNRFQEYTQKNYGSLPHYVRTPTHDGYTSSVYIENGTRSIFAGEGNAAKKKDADAIACLNAMKRGYPSEYQSASAPLINLKTSRGKRDQSLSEDSSDWSSGNNSQNRKDEEEEQQETMDDDDNSDENLHSKKTRNKKGKRSKTSNEWCSLNSSPLTSPLRGPPEWEEGDERDKKNFLCKNGARSLLDVIESELYGDGPQKEEEEEEEEEEEGEGQDIPKQEDQFSLVFEQFLPVLRNALRIERRVKRVEMKLDELLTRFPEDYSKRKDHHRKSRSKRSHR